MRAGNRTGGCQGGSERREPGELKVMPLSHSPMGVRRWALRTSLVLTAFLGPYRFVSFEYHWGAFMETVTVSAA